MKTTIDIPDRVFMRAKKRAVEMRRPFRELVIDGLEQVLGGPSNRTGSASRKIQWVTHPGGGPEGVDVADRSAMMDWLRKHT